MKARPSVTPNPSEKKPAKRASIYEKPHPFDFISAEKTVELEACLSSGKPSLEGINNLIMQYSVVFINLVAYRILRLES